MRINVVPIGLVVGLPNLGLFPLVGVGEMPVKARAPLGLPVGAIMVLAFAGPILRGCAPGRS